MPGRGLLIVIEGLDRSGKSTQCANLVTHIESLGQRVRYQKFPDRTTSTGQIINAYLTSHSRDESPAEGPDDHAVHLLFSANRWEARQQIIRDLESGITVVVDRYSFSGAVYSAAKRLTRPSLDLAWAWAPEIGLPRPDLVIFFDVSPDIARGRGGYGDERYEQEEMQRRVRTVFGDLWAMLAKRRQVDVRIVDAGRTAIEVGEDVKSIYQHVSESVESKSTTIEELQALS